MVSRKVSKKAIIRNKIKKRLAEAVKIEMKNIKNGTDLVIIVLPGAEKKNFSEIKEVVRDALVKAELIIKE